MKTLSLGIRTAGLAVAAVVTISTVWLIADYAYPPAHAVVLIAASVHR